MPIISTSLPPAEAVELAKRWKLEKEEKMIIENHAKDITIRMRNKIIVEYEDLCKALARGTIDEAEISRLKDLPPSDEWTEYRGTPVYGGYEDEEGVFTAVKKVEEDTKESTEDVRKKLLEAMGVGDVDVDGEDYGDLLGYLADPENEFCSLMGQASSILNYFFTTASKETIKRFVGSDEKTADILVHIKSGEILFAVSQLSDMELKSILIESIKALSV